MKIKGWGAVFNTKDYQGDIIALNAFSIKKDIIPMLEEHKKVIGFWDFFEQNYFGLYICGKLLVKNIEKKGLSIGYEIIESYPNKDGVIIKKCNLIEVSIVKNPANSHACLF